MIRTCGVCGAGNRVPARRLADAGRCGACKAALAPVSEPIDADAGLFDEVVSTATVPVLVDFWAAWCGPCRMAAPEVRELAREMSGRALVLKVDTEANPALAARFGVQSIPNFMVLGAGKVLLQRPGLTSRQEMRRWLEAAGARAA